jgi:hypothetical protein
MRQHSPFLFLEEVQVCFFMHLVLVDNRFIASRKVAKKYRATPSQFCAFEGNNSLMAEIIRFNGYRSLPDNYLVAFYFIMEFYGEAKRFHYIVQ